MLNTLGAKRLGRAHCTCHLVGWCVIASHRINCNAKSCFHRLVQTPCAWFSLPGEFFCRCSIRTQSRLRVPILGNHNWDTPRPCAAPLCSVYGAYPDEISSGDVLGLAWEYSDGETITFDFLHWSCSSDDHGLSVRGASDAAT